VLALPYFTAIPYIGFLEWLIKAPPKTVFSQKHQNLRKVVSCRRKLGLVLSVLSVLGSVYGIFIISASKTQEQNLGWQVDFSIAMFQDFLITPCLFLFTQFIFYKISKSDSIKSKRFKAYIAAKLLDSNIARLYARSLNSEKGIVKIRSNRMAKASTTTKSEELLSSPSESLHPQRLEALGIGDKSDILSNISMEKTEVQESKLLVQSIPTQRTPFTSKSNSISVTRLRQLYRDLDDTMNI
jgi:hypothetical protein